MTTVNGRSAIFHYQDAFDLFLHSLEYARSTRQAPVTKDRREGEESHKRGAEIRRPQSWFSPLVRVTFLSRLRPKGIYAYVKTRQT